MGRNKTPDAADGLVGRQRIMSPRSVASDVYNLIGSFAIPGVG